VRGRSRHHRILCSGESFDGHAENDELFIASAAGFKRSDATLLVLAQERWRKTEFEGRSWSGGAVGNSWWVWLRVLWYERYGWYPIRRIATGVLVFAILAAVVSTLVFHGFSREPMSLREVASIVYSLICEPAKVGAIGYILGVMASVMFLIGAVFMPLPRTSYLYTLSRTGRARLVHLSSVVHTTLLVLAFASVGLASAGGAAQVAGVAFRPTGVPLFLRAMIGALPFVPLWQWYAFAELTRFPLLTKLLAVVGLLGAVLLGVAASGASTPFFAMLAWIALAIAASQGAYRWSLRTLFRNVDLIGVDPDAR
jgi:hypothetical protein